jgi:hypothetical protein
MHRPILNFFFQQQASLEDEMKAWRAMGKEEEEEEERVQCATQ